MSKQLWGKQPFRSLSLLGFLSLISGCGLLYAYVRYPRLWRRWNESSHMAYIVLVSILVFWGMQQLIARRARPRHRSTRSNNTTRPDVSNGSEPQKTRIPWLGIILTLMGLQVLFVVYRYPFAALMKWAGAASGIALVICGIRELFASLILRNRHSRPRNWIALPVPGAFYLIIMFVTAFGSIIGRSNLMLLVFSLMAGPFVVNGWFIFSMLKRTRVHRIAPKTAMAGDPVSVELVFENRKRFFSSWLMNAGDQISNDNEFLETGVLFARIAPRSRQNGHYRMRLMQRGWYRLGPIRLNTRFPLGLVERGLIFDEYDDVLVFPRLGRLLPAWNRESLNAPELVQRRQPKQGAFDDEFHRIREYRSGDNPRAIHWRTSARNSELMVREYYPTRDRNLVIMLDLYLPERPREEDRERVELAVSFAATVCVDHMRQSRHSKVVVASAGSNVKIWEGIAGPGGIESLLESLAQVVAGPRPDVEQLLDATAAGRTADSRSVFITTRVENENANDGGSDSLQTTGRNVESGDEIRVISVGHESISHYFQLD